MSDIQKAIETLMAMQVCEKGECNGECSSCKYFGILSKDLIFTYDAAIAALQEKQHNDELRQQGKLVELPCAVEDIAYALVSTESGYIIKKMQVKEIQLKHRAFGDAVFMLESVGRRGCLFKYYETDFGKAVFLTLEAAEAALKGMSKGD